MKAALWFLAALPVVLGKLQPRDCIADNCARAVTGTSTLPGKPDITSRREDCSSFMRTTVTPAPIVTTITITAGQGPLKRRQQTVVPSDVPTYASSCSGAARYSSACSCWGITATVTTAPTPTATAYATVTATCRPGTCGSIVGAPCSQGTCFCAFTVDGPAVCAVDGPCGIPCSSNADCGPGGACTVDCCATSTCADLAIGSVCPNGRAPVNLFREAGVAGNAGVGTHSGLEL